MQKLITVDKAKREVKRLQHYLNLVESYETDTLEKWVIKEYARTNSISQIVENANAQMFFGVDKDFVRDVIKSKPQDELHKILKTGYLYKTRPNRRKI